MPIDYKAQDFDMPMELRNRIHIALEDTHKKQMQRLNTPVPGNKQGGFPGLDLVAMKEEMVNARKGIIDDWNAEHQD